MMNNIPDINKVYHGKMEDVLKTFPDNFFDSCITDPPYGISFMNKHWDYNIPSTDQWGEVYRVLKPGAHILVACGTRTQHRMVVNIEDAGFEIRDVITWHYGSGFPKSLDISKAIDKELGADREIIGKREHPTLADKSKINRQSTHQFHGENNIKDEWDLTKPATPEAQQWDGYGTALKPATEFFTLARKPLGEKTIAQNVLKHGTGGLNIDACRIPFVSDTDKQSAVFGRGTDIMGGNYVGAIHGNGKEDIPPNDLGRYPANLILDDFISSLLDQQAPDAGAYAPVKRGMPGESKGIYGDYAQKGDDGESFYNDIGGASRFFYCAKTSTYERNKGLENFEAAPMAASNQAKAELLRGNSAFESNNDGKSSWSSVRLVKNDHPTVKPIELMRWLVKLITPKKGLCLDPFCGSGSTLIGAKMELINYIGIDMVERYVKMSEARLKAWNPPMYLPQTLF